MAFDPDAYLAEPSGFDPDAYLAGTPTPSPTPTAIAEAGEEDGFLAKINAALRKPSPEWLRAPEEATRKNIMAMMPHDVPSYLESLYLPAHVARQTIDMIEPLFHGETKQIPLVGRIQDIIEAEKTPAGSEERYGTAERTLMDVALLAGVGAKPRIPLRAADPIVPPATRVPSETAALAERITQPRVEPPVTPEVPITEPTTASVPMMITRQMEADLRAAGVSEAEINALTPQAAHDILTQAPSPPTTGVPVEPLYETTKTQPDIVPTVSSREVGRPEFVSEENWPQALSYVKTKYGGTQPLTEAFNKWIKAEGVKFQDPQMHAGQMQEFVRKIIEEPEDVAPFLPKAPPPPTAPVEQPSRAGPPSVEPPVPPVPPADLPFTPEGAGAPARKTRKFSLQLQADTDLIQNIKDNIGNQTYEPIPRTVTMDQAARLVDERPIHEVITAIKDEANGISGRVRATMGEMAIKRLNKAARDLAESGKTAEADVAADRTIDIAEWMQEYGTRSGQTVQAFSNYALLGPEAKLMDVTRKVRKARANREHEFPGEVDEITGALNGDDPVAAFRKLFKTNKTARKVKPRMQRLIEAARTGKLTEKEFYDIASDRLNLPKYDPATAREIMRMAQEIERLPEGMPRDEATLKLNKFIATRMGFRLSDLPMGVYYGNMLSGYNTHIVNALDTFLNVSSEVTGMAMSNPRSAMKIFGNTLRGFNEGRADALMALSRGRMLTNSRWMEIPRLMEVAKFGEKGGVPPLGKGLPGRIATRLAESKAGYPLNAWKYIGRLMSASDSIWYRGAKEARATLLADRVARSERLRGKALNRRVQEELGRTTEQETLYEQQAKDEGFSGPSAQARLNELRERGRSMEANADADDFAGLATYNQQPKGVLGYFAKKVSEASEKYPALRTVVPFTQIVANVTNRGLNYTPLGIRRAFSRYSGEIPKGDAKRAMLMRGVLGSTGLGLLYGLQQQGAVEIHGAGPSDPDKRKQLQEAGWRPYSMKVGDHYVSYLPTPLGLGLSILGNMSDVQRYGEMDQKSALLRGTYALTRVGSTIFSQSFLSSLSTVFEALSGQSPGQQLAAWRRFVSSVSGTVTTPKIVLDVQRIFDPKRYESNTIAGDLLKNTPFSAMVNRPILNAFGEPIEPPTNRFISEASDDPAWRAIAEANLRVRVPNKYTTMPDGRGGKRQITPEEYYEYLEKSGPLVKQYIVRDTFNLTHMPPDKAQDLLDKKSQEIRERVLKDIRRRAQFTPAD